MEYRPDDRLHFTVLFFGSTDGEELLKRLAEIQATLDQMSPGRGDAVLTATCTSVPEQALFELINSDSPDLVFVSNEVGLDEVTFIKACEMLGMQMGLHDGEPRAILRSEDVPKLCRVFEQHRVLVRTGTDADVVRDRVIARCTIYS